MTILQDKDGHLIPAIRNLLNLAFLFVGVVCGWLAHANWVHRGEAKQIVEDMEVGSEVEKTRMERTVDLKKRTKEANNEFSEDGCLEHSNADYVERLRDSLGDEEF